MDKPSILSLNMIERKDYISGEQWKEALIKEAEIESLHQS
jgi:hypothetical protein